MPANSERPLGPIVENWSPPPAPEGATLEGRFARLEALSAERHGSALFAAFRGHDALWDYMPYGPFVAEAAYCAWIDGVAADQALVFYAIIDLDSGEPGGVASYLRIKPDSGSIEVGHINLAPRLQRRRAATEAMFLMMRWAFDAGYRRFEWKCDALNRASRAAAQRLGLSYEGVFRQATVVKGRNRDTAWFAATDTDWPALQAAFRAWLDPANFSGSGRQIRRLSDLTQPVLVTTDPALG